MRALLLVALLALPAFAGCLSPGERQWAGVANAYQYRDFSLVEVQVHSTRLNQAPNAGTAHAGMVAMQSIVDAYADVTRANGSIERFPLVDWYFDRLNDTAVARLPTTGYDEFHMNATFVLNNGTRLATHDPVNWHEEFTRPFYGIMDVREAAGSTTLTLDVYEVRDNATYFEYLGEGPEGTLRTANISTIDAWHLRIKGANGTTFDESAQPTAGATRITLTLPYVGIVEAEPRFTLTLRDGRIVTQRDVDHDSYPLENAIKEQRVQDN